jgi:type IV/VI secretion system ImpK/VasF family protein
MTLLELCEPLFEYVCRLNRAARGGASDFDFNRVRREVTDIFKDMRSRAMANASLIGQYEKIENPLIFFVDFSIVSGPVSFAHEWQEHRLAYELDPPCMVGDSEFFVYVDQTLKDRSEQGTERIAVLYSCIGLGFTGEYMGQPDYVRRKMQEMSTRIRDMMESNKKQICPEAYENIDDRDLIEKGYRPLWGFGVGLALMLIVLFIANVVFFNDSKADLTSNVKKVLDGVNGAPDSKPVSK